VVHNHFGQGLANQFPGELSCRIHGQKGNALINYWGKATLRSFDDTCEGAVENLYDAGAARNIAAFHQDVIEGRYQNETARRAVAGALTCILGREAAARGTRLTMTELLAEKKRSPVTQLDFAPSPRRCCSPEPRISGSRGWRLDRICPNDRRGFRLL
jgi:hypothetical protein